MTLPPIQNSTSPRAVLTRQDLLLRGWGQGEVRAAVRDRDLQRVRRGAYVGSPGLTATEPAAAYRELVLATAMVNPASTVSHLSAAVLHGLPLVETGGTIHLTSPRVGGGRRIAGVHRHGACGPGSTVMLERVRVTGLDRTLADVCRSESLHTSVPMLDAALHDRRTTPAALRSLSAALVGSNGIGRFRRALELADGSAESPGESLTRLIFGELALPAPIAQANVFDAGGRWVARVDFLIQDAGVVVEFDGMVKYGAIPDGPDGRTALIREKAREDALRGLGLMVVRVIWRDLYRPGDLGRRVELALTCGARAAAAGLVTARFFR